MRKTKNKAIPQINKNNKTKPENLMKKEYLESYDKLKKDIKESTSMRSHRNSTMEEHFRIIVN